MLADLSKVLLHPPPQKNVPAKITLQALEKCRFPRTSLYPYPHKLPIPQMRPAQHKKRPNFKNNIKPIVKSPKPPYPLSLINVGHPYPKDRKRGC